MSRSYSQIDTQDATSECWKLDTSFCEMDARPQTRQPYQLGIALPSSPSSPLLSNSLGPWRQRPWQTELIQWWSTHWALLAAVRRDNGSRHCHYCRQPRREISVNHHDRLSLLHSSDIGPLTLALFCETFFVGLFLQLLPIGAVGVNTLITIN